MRVSTFQAVSPWRMAIKRVVSMGVSVEAVRQWTDPRVQIEENRTIVRFTRHAPAHRLP